MSFAIRRPKRAGDSHFSYPQEFRLHHHEKRLLDDPSSGFSPEAFLSDLCESKYFGVQIGVGLPENKSFPTLSYSDFYSLPHINTACWPALYRYISEKYSKRSKESGEIATVLSERLGRFKGNVPRHGSVLVVPGF